MHTFRNLLPDIVIFLLIIVCAYIVDSLLHLLGRADWGRNMGIFGVLLLMLSFLYSARKRRIIRRGNPKLYLRLHEIFAWAGSVLILVHGGVHLNILLPWLSMIAMLISLASGVTGRYLLKRSLALVRSKRGSFVQQGLSHQDIEARLFWDALVVGAMKKWRSTHFVVTVVFVFLACLHMVSIFIFWDWSL